MYGPTALLSYLHTCPSELQVRRSSASTSEQDFAAASQRGVQLPALLPLSFPLQKLTFTGLLGLATPTLPHQPSTPDWTRTVCALPPSLSFQILSIQQILMAPVFTLWPIPTMPSPELLLPGHLLCQ